ncbi:phage tail tip lysozyme, partial [Staphylococcus aureus]
AKQRGLDPRSDEANYGFLKWELQNTHKHAISNLKNATGSEDEMRVFERDFEGAGVKAYGSRFRYAREALKAYEDAQKSKPTGLPPLNFPQGGFSPGGFDVSKATAGAPLGASTTNNSTSNQVTMQNSMSIKIDGSGDPATT